MTDPEPTPTPPATWAWDEDPAAVPRSSSSRRWLLPVAAGLPWLVVATLLLRTSPEPAAPQTVVAAAPAPTAGPPSSTDRATVEPLPAADRGTGPSVDAEPTALTVSSAARHRVDVGDAVTVAMLVARAWFTGPGPTAHPAHEELAGGVAGYVEHAWVEAVDAPWTGHVVVTLGLVVLEADGEHLVPVARRLAVPVRLDASGARAAGPPYALPAPDITYDALEFAPVDDTDRALAAVEALTEGGYAVDALVELARSDGWPWAVTVRATAPGATTASTHRIWLRPDLGGFVVAGWLPESTSDDTRARTDQEEVAP